MAAGYGLAESFVLRKLHKEKMKIMKEEERANMDEIEFKEKKTSGCFIWAFKKIHPSSSQIMGSPRKEVETWDYKDC
ncbi:hypothetical protein FCV25MIE_12463 [Fagus crenata]